MSLDIFVSMKRKVGRPKMAKKDKKIGISIKLKPETVTLLNQVGGKNKSVKIETAIIVAYSKC
jgi:hypothetical protein